MDKFVASDALRDALEAEIPAVGGYTDEVAVAAIVTVPFTATKDIDETTIPADTVTFNDVNLGAPALVATPESGGKSLLWDDPVGGNVFTSTAAAPAGNAYGYRVDSDSGNFLGCQSFPVPIPISMVGQVIVIGEIRLPVDLAEVFEGV